MSEFRTIIEPPKSPFVIDPNHRLMAIGSCFAMEIGQLLEDRKFYIDLNPFGILFNPVSIAEALEIICKGKNLSEAELVEHGGLWHSLGHHGSFSGTDPGQTLAHINDRIQKSHQSLALTETILLTLGSAHAYQHLASGRVVANCHKIPASHFNKVQLSLDQIDGQLQLAISMATEINPGIKFIVSVSPVRYWKDGPVANQRSKSRLILATEALCERNQNVEYFPAYEALMDDLRDYRFYGEDLLHPNSVAIKYIWDLFMRTYFSEEATEFAEIFEAFSQSLLHRPIHPNSSAELRRIQNLKQQLNQLESRFPNFDFDRERSLIQGLSN